MVDHSELCEAAIEPLRELTVADPRLTKGVNWCQLVYLIKREFSGDESSNSTLVLCPVT